MRLNRFLSVVLLLAMTACGGMQNDLFPSGQDKQSTGTQYAPDFTVYDSLGNSVTLSSVETGHKAVVLYFTMWCPVCDTDMSFIRDNLIPAYPDIVFFGVDYVSGSITAARNAEVSNGYDGSGITILADTNQTILNAFGATMGTIVVIDATNVINMNENFKDGSKLSSILASLP